MRYVKSDGAPDPTLGYGAASVSSEASVPDQPSPLSKFAIWSLRIGSFVIAGLLMTLGQGLREGVDAGQWAAHWRVVGIVLFWGAQLFAFWVLFVWSYTKIRGTGAAPAPDSRDPKNLVDEGGDSV